jgi:putative DNA primase/helicase
MMMCPSDLRSIARALNGEVVSGQVSCPGPGHGPKDKSLSVKLSASAPLGFIAFSHAGDDFASCRDYVAEKLGLDRNGWKHDRAAPPRPAPRAADPTDERVAAYIGDIVADLKPLHVSPGVIYFRETRHIHTDPISDVLDRTDAIGWHPAIKFNEPGHELHCQHLGCIVAIMTDPLTAKPTGAISRTYIHSRRKVGKAKTLGNGGGVVHLSRDEDSLGGLLLAEGLETALAAMSIGLRPIWSTGSTSIMGKFPLLSGVECLQILADHDTNGAGERAAREVETRWKEAGKAVRIWAPASPGDFNDVLRGLP